MDIMMFLKKIEAIVTEIDNIIKRLDKTEHIDKTEIRQLLSEVSQMMEIWLYFIREMRSADEQLLLALCEDIAEAVLAEDRIRLTDALLFGLRDLLCEYYIVLKEAVDEE